MLFIYFQRGEGREKERERNINVWLLLKHLLLGTRPTTQACAQTGNLTSDPLVLRPALSPLSHTSQGSNLNSLISCRVEHLFTFLLAIWVSCTTNFLFISPLSIYLTIYLSFIFLVSLIIHIIFSW